jgi:hypothetical protein
MTPQELLRREHQTLRVKSQTILDLLKTDRAQAAGLLEDFRTLIQKHFRREDFFYRRIDDGKRVSDRGLMHTLRNDHAAVLFTLESLAIKLRKGGPTPEWEKRLMSMFDVLLPHLDHEEADLFPLIESLSEDDRKALLHDMEKNA